jgi:uncharacterized protein
MVSRRLIEAIRQEFKLDWKGIHGAPHWARVRDYGLRLAKVNGARAEVVEFFALLHDSRRLSDGSDPDHGKRAAQFALSLRGNLITLSDADFDLLTYACVHHSSGWLDADITVQTCWDADRLDLGRVGIRPSAERLCTEAARKFSLDNAERIAPSYEDVFGNLD